MMRSSLVLAVTLTSVEALAYVPYKSGDKALHWPTAKQTIDLTVVPANSPMPLSDFKAVVNSAFEQWADVGDAVPAARVTASNDTPVEDDHQVQFLADAWPYDPNALAVTVFSYKKSSGELVDADIFINATGPCLGDAAKDDKCYDLQAVLTHEAGHFMGLDHDADIHDAVMYPSAEAGTIAKRALQEDDREGVISTYGGQMNPIEQMPVVHAQIENKNQQDVARAGCNAAGAGWWMLIALIAFFRAGVAQASSVAKETISAQLERSDAVFVGRAVAKRSYFDVALGFIVTEHTLAVDECVRGACEGQMTFRTLGGEVGDMVTRVSGESEPPQEAQALFVASKRKAGRAFVFESTAFGQGILPLDAKLGVFRSKAAWVRLDEVRK